MKYRLKMRPVVLAVLVAVLTASGCSSSDGHDHSHLHVTPNGDLNAPVTASLLPPADCVNGMAGTFPCSLVDLKGGLSFSAEAADIWGWHDERSGTDYAILGLTVGTAFIRMTDPSAPELIAFLPTATTAINWRDIKVLDHYAVIVSEAPGHGLQVVDLHNIAALEEYTVVAADAHYREFGAAHNVAVNEETSTVYVVGSNTCGAGLHMIDMASPLQPKHAGCYSQDGYIHDAQCVIYDGPDTRYLGRELCFAANAHDTGSTTLSTLTIIDVSDKSAPQQIAKMPYLGASYAHQGWLTEDQRFFLLGDEVDELEGFHNTRTYIWDLSDLQNPLQTYEYTADTAAIDHNLYVLDDHVYQANYMAGVRILRHGALDRGEMVEVGYFDTDPRSDGAIFEGKAAFIGAWSVYPYYANGLMVTANIDGDFFVLQSRVEERSRCEDGVDNDADGQIDNEAECV